MTVSSLTVIFLITIGTTFVTCTALPNKHGKRTSKVFGLRKSTVLEEKKAHDDTAPEILFRALSDYDVAQRSLDSVMPEKSSNLKSEKSNIIDNLKLSVIFRENMLYIFSYLLHGRENGLTEEQYTSLQMLYDVLWKKMIPVYNMLPILPKLQSRDKSYQTRAVLLSLTKNLPSYLQCTATFLAQEIESKRFDVNSLLPPPGKVGTFNYFTNVSPDAIHENRLTLVDEEMSGYDKSSNITQKALGPVYVKLLNRLHTNSLPLSQELFGLILMNLPNPNGDPILEEHIRYLYDMSKNNLIMNWDLIRKDVVHPNAYKTVFSVLSNIIRNPNTGIAKTAAIYVNNHLKMVTPTYANPYFEYMHNLIKLDINMGLLLSAIVPQEFDTDTIRMKDRLLMYFVHNLKNKNMDLALNGFNKYAYQDPLDLLMAFLTRIIDRVPTSAQNILQPATALIPVLIMKKHTRTFTPFVSPEIDILTLLESLKNPDLNSIFSWVTDPIMYELISNPRLTVLLNSLIPTEKSKCITPRQCLTNTITKVPKMQVNLPMTLTTKIQNLVHILKSIVSQQQSFSMLPIEAEVHDVETISRSPIIIEVSNVPAYNLPHGNVPYLWNINKYINEARPVEQSPQSITLEWQTGIPTEIELTEGQVVGHIPPQNNLPNQSLTANVSLTTTSSYQQKEFQIKNTPEKPQIMQPDASSVVIETAPTEYSSETDITNIQVSKGMSHEEMNLQQPSITIESGTLQNVLDIIKSTISNEEPTTRKPRVELPKNVYIEKILPTTRKPSQKIYETIIPKVPPQKILENVIQKVPATISSESVNVDVSVNVQEDSDKRPKPWTTIKEPSASLEKESIAMLPPSIKPDQPLVIQLSGSGVPVVTMGDNSKTTVPGLVLPGIKELLQTPNLKNPLLGNTSESIVQQVLQPLSAIFGKNYVRKILKNVDLQLYPTNIALLSALLKAAKTLPQVIKNTELSNLIRKYIATIEYVSPTILLPIVISSKKLKSVVVYSTFNLHDTTHGDISENPPDEASTDSVTIPLMNPKTWLQSVNPSDPYSDLIPTLPDSDPMAITLRPLKTIMTFKKIVELLGPDFQPLAYPNKGALLITLLHKLGTIKMVQSNPSLQTLINNYILALELPSMYVQVSEDSLVKMMSESKGHWQPELTSLISALPTSKNDAEEAMMETMEQFLSDPTILEKLHVEIPSTTMSRGEFLHKIILSALSSKMQLEQQTMNALRYYNDRIEFDDMGALPIMWVWVEVYVVKAEVQLGNMIQQTLNFHKLAYKEKLAYNDVISYLAKNPDLLQNNQDFEFEKYKTQGEFVKALFQYIMKKRQINGKIKKHIKMLLPKVQITGAGAIALPSFSES